MNENLAEMIEAIKQGDQGRAGALLEQEPGLAQAQTEQGLSLVLLAVYYREPQIAALLASKRAELDIFEASALGNVERVRQLAEDDPLLVNAFAADGFTPLGLASFFGHTSLVSFLLNLGAEVNAASRNPMKVMPLHSAVARQSLEISRLLLAAGAEVNARQADDFTPLHEAAQNGQLEMAELLLDYGADPTLQKSDGQTAYDLALAYHHPRVAEFLLGAEQ